MGPTSLSQAKNVFFCHFREFESYVFYEITYNDGLRQYVGSGRSKIHEKKLGAQLLGKVAKIRPEVGSFCHFVKVVN